MRRKYTIFNLQMDLQGRPASQEANDDVQKEQKNTHHLRRSFYDYGHAIQLEFSEKEGVYSLAHSIDIMEEMEEDPFSTIHSTEEEKYLPYEEVENSYTQSIELDESLAEDFSNDLADIAEASPVTEDNEYAEAVSAEEEVEVLTEQVKEQSIPDNTELPKEHPHNVFDEISKARQLSSEIYSKDHPHAVFDEINRAQSYANTFDLGEIVVDEIESEKNFDEFDNEMDQKQQDDIAKMKTFEEDLEWINTPENSTAMALSDGELADDLEALTTQKTEKKPEESQNQVQALSQKVATLEESLKQVQNTQAETLSLPATEAPQEEKPESNEVSKEPAKAEISDKLESSDKTNEPKDSDGPGDKSEQDEALSEM